MTRIDYDQRSLIIDGRRELLISGSVHYPRLTPASWPDVLRESKRQGCNCIDTYVFWEGHEPQQGQYDFTDRFDLGAFLDACAAEGLYVILRFGPYVCSEWNFGGLPWWLLAKKGMVSRTWNEPFMRAMDRWCRVFTARFRDYQASRGGPVILWQMENEYGNVAQSTGQDGARYLQWCADLAVEAGVEVPVIMCYGAPRGVLETINGFRAWDQAERLFAERPGQPALWTENWPGWYNVWCQPVRNRRSGELAFEVLRFFAVGGSGVNYYMWYGGTNFARDGMYLQTTDYDFGCPLDSYGLATTKAAHLAKLHRFLRKHRQTLLEGEKHPAEALARGEAENPAEDGVLLYRYSHGGDEVAFVVNAANEAREVRTLDKKLRLAPCSGMALAVSAGAWVVGFDSAKQPRIEIEREMILAGVPVHWQARGEPLPGSVEDSERAFHTVRPPHNMVLDTLDETDYGVYRTTFPSRRAGTARLQTHVADLLYVWINGQYAGRVPEMLKENRRRKDFAVSIDLPVCKGDNELVLMVASLGLIKHDVMISAPMSKERKGVIGPVKLDGEKLDGPSEFSAGTWGERHGLYVPAVASLANWAAVGKVEGPMRWYRGTFELGETALDDPLPWALDSGELNKGMIWINGSCLGRYWQAAVSAEDQTTRDWFQNEYIYLSGLGRPPQRYYQIPPDWLHAGVNTLVIFEERFGVPTGTNLVRRR